MLLITFTLAAVTTATTVRGDSILDEGDTSKEVWETTGFSEIQQTPYQNNKIQLLDMGPKPRNRPSRNILFDKEGDRQVAGFSKKLTRHQPIANIVSR
jgi:hypothetical protein